MSSDLLQSSSFDKGIEVENKVSFFLQFLLDFYN